jgi:hypothetical protein
MYTNAHGGGVHLLIEQNAKRMNSSAAPPAAPRDESGRRSRMGWLMVLCGLVLVLAALLRGRWQAEAEVQPTAASTPAAGPSDTSARDRLFARRPRRGSSAEPMLTPAQVVSNKVAQFARHRREVLDAMARKLKCDVPEEVQRFFDAAEAGNWDEMDAIFKVLVERRKIDGPENSARLWGPILDTYGAAEQAHDWPAQKLLDYGQAVLDSLRPGMVYIGGTDEGRWIPELLNDTSEGERHIIVTQNAFADGSYLEYVTALYGDRINTLMPEDSQKAFQEYLADAQKRFHHDQQFPDEPKQLRPGEDIQVNDNRVQVSGQVAVMAINEILLRSLMEKNPDLSFALQESFPLRGTYGNAAPLGPIMELGVPDVQSTFTAERVAQSLEYWRGMAQQLATDPEASGSPDTLKSYAKLALGQANLLADHQYSAEAEQAYRLSTQIWPGNLESVSGLSELLLRTGRGDEARRLMDDFERRFPGQRSEVEKARARWQFIASAPGPPRP